MTRPYTEQSDRANRFQQRGYLDRSRHDGPLVPMERPGLLQRLFGQG